MKVEAIRTEAQLRIELGGKSFEVPVPARDPEVRLDVDVSNVSWIEFRNLRGGRIKIHDIVIHRSNNR